MTEDEKKQIIADFQKAFDLVKLSSEIIDRLTTPAKPNAVYEAVLTKFESGKSKLGKPYKKVEMKTDNKEILTTFFSDFTSHEYGEFAMKAEIGARYRVLYVGDKFPEIKILEKLSEPSGNSGKLGGEEDGKSC